MQECTQPSGMLVRDALARMTALSDQYASSLAFPHEASGPVHAVEIDFAACVDERADPTAFFDLPSGICFVFRNPGRIHWAGPSVGPKVLARTRDAFESGRAYLMVNTCHDASGDASQKLLLGCKANRYDRNQALNSTWEQTCQLARWFDYRDDFASIMVMLDTDTGQACFFGEDPDARLKTGEVPVDIDAHDLSGMLAGLYPRMAERSPALLAAVTVLARRNLAYVKNHPSADRNVAQRGHRGSYLCVGEGLFCFDRNEAVVVGPYGLNMSDHIKVGVEVIRDNYDNGILARDQPWCLIAQASCSRGEPSHIAYASDQARDYHKVAVGIVEKVAGHILPNMEELIGYVNRRDLKFTRVAPHCRTRASLEMAW